MAHMNINLSAMIHAEIVVESDFILANNPLIIDPLTRSYTDYPDAKLTFYSLEVISSQGLSNVKLLENGKNSRFTADGQGQCTIELYIEDSLGNTATDSKIIYVE